MAREAGTTTTRHLAWAGYGVLLAGAGAVGIHFGWSGEPNYRLPTLTPEAATHAPASGLERSGGNRGSTRDDAEAAALADIAPAAGGAPTPSSGDPRAGFPEPPNFDIVRVSREGTTVLAGRAPEGARVTVLDGAEPLARVASRGGEWAVVLDVPLAPGAHELSLEATLPTGDTVRGPAPVLVIVPESRKAEEAARVRAKARAAVAVRLAARSGEASLVLTRAEAGQGGGVGLSLDAVDYGEEGDVTLSGSAPSGTAVRAYLNDRLIGVARAERGNSWRLAPERAVRPGSYSLRVDQIDSDGVVAARIEVPFVRAVPVAARLGEDRRIVVQPGNNLWRIARRTYGDGMLYTTIYHANAGQIRDPDLIYPGQIFSLPALAAR